MRTGDRSAKGKPQLTDDTEGRVNVMICREAHARLKRYCQQRSTLRHCPMGLVIEELIMQYLPPHPDELRRTPAKSGRPAAPRELRAAAG